MKRSGRAWALVGLLSVAAVFNYLDRQVIFSLFPPLRAELRLSNVELGLLGTVFLWVYGILSPFAGFAADKFGRSRTIILSLGAWSAVTWATAHATSSAQLLAARGLLGVSQACYIPAALAMIAGHHPERTRSRAVGIHQVGIALGLVLSGVLGGWVGQHYGWRAVFTLLGVAGVAYAAGLAVSLPRVADPQHRKEGAEKPQLRPALRELLGTPNFVRMASVNAISSIAWWIVYAWLPYHLFERFQMSLAEAGFTATFYLQAASFTGILAGGWLADFWSQRTARGRLLTQVAGFLLAGPALFVLGVTWSVPVVVSCLLVAGIGRGFYDCNTMPVMCQFTRPELRSTGFGIYNFASSVMSGTMTAGAGALKDSLGLGGALAASALIVLLCALYMMSIRFEPAAAASGAGS